MKKTLLLLTIFLSGISSFAQVAVDSLNIKTIASDSIPRASGWVNDFEKIYTKAEIKSLDSLIAAFEKKKGYEIAIITLDANYTNDTTFDRYITAVANAWGVGKKGKDNGMVIGISSEFGRIRIVNGAGVTTYLSDDATKIIIDTIFIPNFQQGNYYKGTKEALLEIMKKLK